MWWFLHTWGNVTNLHPLHVGMLVEFTNLTPDPLTIEAYEFQTKMTAFGKWERVHVVYTDSTNMYWGTNMKHLKKMEFEKPIFDEVALNQFTPNVPVGGVGLHGDSKKVAREVLENASSGQPRECSRFTGV